MSYVELDQSTTNIKNDVMMSYVELDQSTTSIKDDVCITAVAVLVIYLKSRYEMYS